MAKRFQSRRRNGRFQRNTMENCFGLHAYVCPNPDCRRFTTWNIGTPKPTTCHACGQLLDPDNKPVDVEVGR